MTSTQPIPRKIQQISTKKISEMEGYIRAGCTEEEASAVVDIHKDDWLGYVARQPAGYMASLTGHSLRREAQRKFYDAKVVENIPRLVEAQITLALTDSDKLAPTRLAAIKDLIDRVHGKPTEHIDHTTKGESLNVAIVQYAPKE